MLQLLRILPFILLTCNCKPRPHRVDHRDKKPVAATAEQEPQHTGPASPKSTYDGQAFFEKNVLPVFEQNCRSCHVDLPQKPEKQGPLSIYSYDEMKKLLLAGQLLPKMQNQLKHEGGDLCPKGLEESPCKEVKQWAEGETGVAIPPQPPKVEEIKIGDVGLASDLGTVAGWAINPKNPEEVVTVNLFVGKSEGDPLVALKANEAGFDGNYDGNHAFTYKLPSQYCNGTKQKLFALALLEGQARPLNSSPKEFICFAPKDAGFEFFETSVKPKLTAACKGCHTFKYDDAWPKLASPSPAKGGSAINNDFIRYPAANTPHEGGNICGTLEGSPCKEIQAWWKKEFTAN